LSIAKSEVGVVEQNPIFAVLDEVLAKTAVD